MIQNEVFLEYLSDVQGVDLTHLERQDIKDMLFEYIAAHPPDVFADLDSKGLESTLRAVLEDDPMFERMLDEMLVLLKESP